MSDFKLIAENAKKASILFRNCGPEQRNKALNTLSKLLIEQTDAILSANQQDINNNDKSLSKAMLDRLKLTDEIIKSMSKACLDIAKQEEVVGTITDEFTNDDGLVIQKQSIPLGVILMIFESRPNCVIDCAALAIKSGNAIILKGGKEAFHSNKILGEIIERAISGLLPESLITVLSSSDRLAIDELIKLNNLIDLVIPRGGEGLINYIYNNSKVPVIAHFKGLCHLYVHKDANIEQAMDIILNAKCQRPGVCNALETLLVHQDAAQKLLPTLQHKLTEENVIIRGCEHTNSTIKNIELATASDWDTEYLDSILSIKIVENEDKAVEHINVHGTKHTEGIISQDQQAIKKFSNCVDASCIVVNASTRFNDGGQLGLGAELGISTTKIHAYGPMGAKEMTTSRYIVIGSGHTRK